MIREYPKLQVFANHGHPFLCGVRGDRTAARGRHGHAVVRRTRAAQRSEAGRPASGRQIRRFAARFMRSSATEDDQPAAPGHGKALARVPALRPTIS